MTSPFQKRYEELARASHEDPASPQKRIRTLRSHMERNMALHELGRQAVFYGFTEREVRKAIQSAKDDAEFDRKYGQQKREG